MAYQKQQSDSFKVDFVSMPQATEMNVVKMIDYANRASMMGRDTVIRVTRRLEKNIPRSWYDPEYKQEVDRLERQLSFEKSRCQAQFGVNTDKLNDLIERYEEDRFSAIINLLDRIGKFPQKSETEESR